MKKFTFIRFIEPAEREEIGIGHYGAGRGTGRETGGKVARRGPGSLGVCSGARRSGQVSSQQLTADCVLSPFPQAP